MGTEIKKISAEKPQDRFSLLNELAAKCTTPAHVIELFESNTRESFRNALTLLAKSNNDDFITMKEALHQNFRRYAHSYSNPNGLIYAQLLLEVERVAQNNQFYLTTAPAASSNTLITNTDHVEARYVNNKYQQFPINIDFMAWNAFMSSGSEVGYFNVENEGVYIVVKEVSRGVTYWAVTNELSAGSPNIIYFKQSLSDKKISLLSREELLFMAGKVEISKLQVRLNPKSPTSNQPQLPLA